MSASSEVSPEFDRARSTSPRATMPRSPWLASAGCTKNAAVPVEAIVAAIFAPIWLFLPIPVTITRPVAAARISSAALKRWSRESISTARPSISNCSTRRAERSSGCADCLGSERSSGGADCLGSRLGAAWFGIMILAASCELTAFKPRKWSYVKGIRLLARVGAPSVLEDILVGPAGKVQLGPERQEGEASSGQVSSTLARQHLVESGFENMQVEDVGRGV